jgi:hypothetical protein
VGVVLLAISLFWLALTQINAGRSCLIALVTGAGVYLFGSPGSGWW